MTRNLTQSMAVVALALSLGGCAGNTVGDWTRYLSHDGDAPADSATSSDTTDAAGPGGSGSDAGADAGGDTTR